MKKREQTVLKQFLQGARMHGPVAEELAIAFVHLREDRESEFSRDARSLMQKSLSVSGSFSNYVHNFLKNREWVYEPSEEEIEREYAAMSYRERWNTFFN